MTQQQIEERNRRRLLAAEMLMFGYLAGTFAGADDRTRKAIAGARTEARARALVAEHATLLESEIVSDIEKARSTARIAAAAQHRNELALTTSERSLAEAAAVTRDTLRARAAARSLASPFEALWRRTIGAEPVKAATPAQQLTPRIQRTAATETASAYNEARVALVREERVRHPGLELHVEWFWDATLDKRTCDECGGFAGKRWSIASGPSVTPPIHPYCRCTLTLRSVR